MVEWVCMARLQLDTIIYDIHFDIKGSYIHVHHIHIHYTHMWQSSLEHAWIKQSKHGIPLQTDTTWSTVMVCSGRYSGSERLVHATIAGEWCLWHTYGLCLWHTMAHVCLVSIPPPIATDSCHIYLQRQRPARNHTLRRMALSILIGSHTSHAWFSFISLALPHYTRGSPSSHWLCNIPAGHSRDSRARKRRQITLWTDPPTLTVLPRPHTRACVRACMHVSKPMIGAKWL